MPVRCRSTRLMAWGTWRRSGSSLVSRSSVGCSWCRIMTLSLYSLLVFQTSLKIFEPFWADGFNFFQHLLFWAFAHRITWEYFNSFFWWVWNYQLNSTDFPWIIRKIYTKRWVFIPQNSPKIGGSESATAPGPVHGGARCAGRGWWATAAVAHPTGW